MNYIQIAKKGQLNNYCLFIASRYFTSIEDFINLELCSPRILGNMNKFFYNPISLTLTTRKFFPYLKTLYIYKETDELFEDDENIIAEKMITISYYDLENEWKYLSKWTNKKDIKEMIFDSDKDDWSESTSTFDQQVMGKENLLFIIETEINGKMIKFGGYLSTPIETIGLFVEDLNAFVFTFKDDIPIKCDVLKSESFNAFSICSNSVPALFSFGNRNIHFFKKGYSSKCNQQSPTSFDYHDIDNILIGVNEFIPKRLRVLQLI